MFSRGDVIAAEGGGWRFGVAVTSTVLVLVAMTLASTGITSSTAPRENSGLQAAGGSLPGYLQQFCLSSNSFASHTQVYHGIKFVSQIYPSQNSQQTGPCQYKHYGELITLSNSTTGSTLAEILINLEQYNATITYFWYAPVVATALSTTEEIEVINQSGQLTVYQCQNGSCGPASPGQSTPLGCSVSAQFSSGRYGWAMWANQCYWQQVASYVCAPISNIGWALFILLAVIVGFFTDGIGAVVGFEVAVACGYVSYMASSSSGAYVAGGYVQQCWNFLWWQWCTTIMVVWWAAPGTPPSGF